MIGEAPIALTMGDPAGIGPEITVAAWRAHLSGLAPRFFVLGDPALYRDTGIAVARIGSPEEAAAGDALPILDLPLPRPASTGATDAANAPAIIQSIEHAVELTIAKRAAAIVTNPIAKSTLYEAGFKHRGHTDFLGALTQTLPHAEPRGPVMMLMADNLKVALVTEHLSLKDVSGALKQEQIIRTALVVAAALKKDFGIAEPRLTVAALNPHAGETGAFGDEEIRVIAPAVAQLHDLGLNVRGPLPADTLFHAAAREQTDAVICMYHDQGLIPVKMLDFWGGVNATLGLPIVRTSPDHGTGFSIAGKGIARADSLIAALNAARFIARQRSRT